MAKQISVVVDVQGKIDSFKSAVGEMQGYLNKLSLPALQEGKATSLFGQITREIENIQRLTAKGSVTPMDQKAIEKSEQAIANLLGELNLFAKSPAITGAWSKDLVSAWDKATKAIKEYGTAWADIQKRQEQLEAGKSKAQKTIDTKNFRQKELLGTARARETQYTQNIDKYNEVQKAAYQKAFDEYRKTQSSGRVGYQKVDTWLKSLKPEELQALDLSKKFNLDETQAKLKSIQQIIKDIENGKQVSTEAAAPHKMVGETKDYNLSVHDAEEAAKAIADADKAIQNISTETASRVQDLKKALSGLSSAGVDIQKFLPDGKDINTASYEELVSAFDKLQEELKETADNTPAVEKGMNGIKGAAENLNGVFEETGKSLVELSERQKQAQQTLSRLQYAFSAVSVFQLFKRAIRSARDAVKELDDAMTETAVVTNYTISDLWKKLPEYTKRANELGVSTLAAYQSATLYYQQGLNDTQVSDMSIETLKMARIAGIEAADATNLMTGAIRAFNMEINKMSAQRVNDVYNKLAAMTAANTEGIATAMTKVASIAHSVGAEFENVAAFLAQMIETTQEAPETLGTALKTVFARFAEVKKLYSEGQILGTDEEGEEINVNKIQEALRTVGISMTDFLVGKEGLDQVIMRLAQKWDSLDTVTQRYIVTMAAGSRQQSRFISLLQDFGRTQELINAANNSEGAAQKQFEKTLDSLQSKTEQLKNAWNEFLLDLANSDTIKGVVDLLNNVVTAINKITGALGSSGSGIAKLLLGLGILKGGRALLGGAKTMFDPAMLDKFGGSRIKAFRYGAASQMGFDETNYSTSNSLGGALLKRKGAQFKGFGASFKNTFIKEEREKTRVENEGIKERLANARKEYKEKEQLNEEAQKRLIKARENYSKVEQKQGEFASVSPEKEDLDNAEADATSANQEYLKAQKEVTEASQPAGEKLMQYGQTMQIVGQAAGIAAGACFMLANSLEQSGDTKAAKTFKILGTTLSVLSAVFMVVGSVAQITGAQIAAGAKTASTAIMNIPIIGWIAAVIAGLVALITIIVSFTETTEQRLERLNEEAEKAKKMAESAAQAYDDLLSGKNQYEGLKEKLKELVQGTEEYKKVLEELNTLVLTMAQEDPNLEYYYNPETKALEFTEESLKKAEKIAKYRKVATSSVSYLTAATTELETSTTNAVEAFDDLFPKAGAVGPASLQDAWLNTIPKELKIKALQYLSEEEIKRIMTTGGGTSQLRLTLDGMGAFESGIESFGKYADSFRSAVLLLTNNDTETAVVAEYTTEGIRNKLFTRETNQKYSSREWEDNDFGQKTTFEEENGYTDRWDFMLKEALKQGLISEIDYGAFSTWDRESDEPLKKFVAKISGEKWEDVKDDLDIETAESIAGNWYLAAATAKQVEKETEKFKNLPEDLQEALTTAILKPKDLNVKQIDLINTNWKELFVGTENQEPFLPNFDTTALSNIIKDVEWTGPSSLIDKDSKYLDYYTRGAETMWNNLNKYGNEFGDAYESLFKEIVDNDNLTEKQKERTLEILNSADIKDSKDLWNTIKLLKDEGIDLTKIGLDGAFERFINSLEKAGIAVEKWSKELAESSIKSSRSLKNSIENGELEYTWSKEQYEELEGLLQKTKNADLLNNFTENLDGTYTYSSSDLNPIINALNSIDNTLGKEYKERLEKKAEVSDEVQNIKNQEFDTAWRNMTHFSGYTQTASFGDNRSEIEQATKEQQLKYYNLILQGLIEAGIDSSTLNELDLPQNITEDLIGEYLPNLLDLIFNNEEIHKELISGIGITSGQGLLYHSALGDQEKEDAYKRLKGTVLTDETASGALAKWGETSLLDENIEKMDDLDAATLALAKDYASLTKAVKSSGEAIGKQIENLKAGPEIGEDYYNSLAETQKALKKLFGKDFTEEEIKNLLPTIEKFTQGSEEAFSELAEVASQKWIPDLEDSGLIEQYNSVIAQMEGAEVGVKVGLDGTTVQATEADMEDLRQALAAKGIVANWTDLGQAAGSPDGLHNYQLNFAVNGGGGFTSKKSGGGGGGKTSPWENPYDKYHNLLQEIDELLRTRNDLERQYEKILANRHSTIQDILKNSRENLANLQKEIAAQERLQKGRREQLRNLANGDYYFDDKGKRSSFAEQAAKFGINLGDYVKYNEKTQQIDIDWDAFEEVERRSEKDAKWAEIGKFLQKYYDKVSELSQSYEETQDTIEEMQDAIEEIRQRSKEDYLDFEQELYDAIVDHIQQFIDAEQELSDSIKNAESKILDNMRESIDLERQIRDNTKTEEDIADKENRLAYLQRDTTGANAVEIMQLQKEIQEARQNYQDTLVDQELERLSRASEEAAEQRQQQIDLMQEQLDWAAKAGYFWEDVESMIQQAFGSGDTTLIEQLLSGVSDFNEKSMFGDRAWKDELIERFLKASEGRANWELDNAKENHTSWATRIAATGKEGTVGIWWDTDKNQWVDAKGNTYTGVGYDVSTGKWKYEGRSDRVQEEISEDTQSPQGGSGGGGTQEQTQTQKPKTYSSTKTYEGEFEGKATSKTSQQDADNQAMKNAINKAIEEWTARSVFMRDQLNQLKANAQMLPRNAMKLTYQRQIDELTEQLDSLRGKLIKARADLTQYKTGGLSTQTGPAWLDGTPSKPEYVLNSAQTAAFLQLSDVLPSIMNGVVGLNAAPATYVIDVDINVDSISSDYDVDRLSERVKEDIYNDMMYRNVNVVNLRR